MSSIEGRIYRVGIVFLGLFLLLTLMATYWQVVRADDLSGNAMATGARQREEEARVERGRVLDRNGEVLVENEVLPDGTRHRVYREPSLAQVVGYHSQKYGDTGMEAVAGAVLVGRTGAAVLRGMALDLLHLPRQGGDVRLTIDLNAQRAAAKAMGAFDGAMVAIDPRTGDILAMISKPYFDAPHFDEQYDQIPNHPSHPLLNRATQALYVPGSTFKMVTLAAALEAGIVNAKTPATCPEQIDVSGFKVTSHNEIPGRPTKTIEDALANSCNTVFADLGLKIGADRLTKMAEAFGITSSPPFQLDVNAGQVGAPDFLAGPQGLAVTGFGPGQLLMTPMHLALIVAAVANGGQVPKPRLVDDGPPGVWRRAMSTQAAQAETAIMEYAGANGHGAPQLAIAGVRVAGKTGSAELEPGSSPHSVFIAFAPVDNPKVAVAVLEERAGSGSLFAAPVVRAVMQAIIQR